MKHSKKEVIPLLTSILLAFATLIIVVTTDYTINIKHYIGFGALIVTSFLFFMNKQIYKYVFIIVLTAGLLGLLDFFYATFEIGFNIVQVNPIFILLLILFFIFSDYGNKPDNSR